MQEAEQLVELQNGEPTTTSLQVAEAFDKRHDAVLRDVKSQIKEVGSTDLWSEFFKEDTYKVRGREYPMYRMNKDGFTLLVMSYTGTKATEFKVRYIQAFNEMEDALKSQSSQLRLPKNNAEMLQVVNDVNEETNKRIDEVKETVDDLKDRFGLPATQAKQLKDARSKHVTILLGGHDSNAYDQISQKVYRQIGHDFKDYFDLPRYDVLPLSKFDEGMAYVRAWQLPTNLALQVRELNSQTELDV